MYVYMYIVCIYIAIYAALPDEKGTLDVYVLMLKCNMGTVVAYDL